MSRSNLNHGASSRLLRVETVDKPKTRQKRPEGPLDNFFKPKPKKYDDGLTVDQWCRRQFDLEPPKRNPLHMIITDF